MIHGGWVVFGPKGFMTTKGRAAVPKLFPTEQEAIIQWEAKHPYWPCKTSWATLHKETEETEGKVIHRGCIAVNKVSRYPLHTLNETFNYVQIFKQSNTAKLAIAQRKLVAKDYEFIPVKLIMKE